MVWLGIVNACPARAIAETSLNLDRIRYLAKREGVTLEQIRLTRQRGLILYARTHHTRRQFIREASLIAYLVFKRTRSETIFIELRTPSDHRPFRRCHIARDIFERYLNNRLSKAQYDKATYSEAPRVSVVPQPETAVRPVVPTPGLTPMPQTPAPVVAGPRPSLAPSPVLVVPAPGLASIAPSPATSAPPPVKGTPDPARSAQGLDPPTAMMTIGCGFGLAEKPYDGWSLEYAHRVLPNLDLRPYLQIISPISPINFSQDPQNRRNGLSVGLDMLATTRDYQRHNGLAIEGGLGLRSHTLTGTADDQTGTPAWWPAMHLRLGWRWLGAVLFLRYPLLLKPADPTANWELFTGYSFPFAAFTHGPTAQ